MSEEKPLRIVKNEFAKIERYAPTKEGEEEIWCFEITQDPDVDPHEQFNPMFELTRRQVYELLVLILDADRDEKVKEKVCKNLYEMFLRGGNANCGVKDCPNYEGE